MEIGSRSFQRDGAAFGNAGSPQATIVDAGIFNKFVFYPYS